MTLIALDYGEKNIGMAMSGGGLAAPVETISSIDEVVRFIKLNHVQKAVVGLPLNAEGKEGFQAKKAREFGERLQKRSKVEVVYWNETLSTKEAARMLMNQGASRKKVDSKLDAVAAAVILQDYLDNREENDE